MKYFYQIFLLRPIKKLIYNADIVISILIIRNEDMCLDMMIMLRWTTVQTKCKMMEKLENFESVGEN